MAAPHRTNEQREIDRTEMVLLLRRGWSKTMIAERFGVHQTQVSYDWLLCVKELRQTRDEECGALVYKALEELAEIKREAWQAWELSKRDAETLREEEGKRKPPQGEGEDRDEEPRRGRRRRQPAPSLPPETELELLKRTKTREGRLPNNCYLQTVLACIAAERQLKGLDAPKEFSVRGTDVWAVIATTAPKSPTALVEEALAAAVPKLPVVEEALYLPSNDEPSPHRNGTNGSHRADE